MSSTQPTSSADERRIAACLKACEGLHTESLERNKPLAEQIVDVLNRLDELNSKMIEMTTHADLAEFMLTHWDSAQMRFHTSGPLIGKPKGGTVIFDFTSLADPSKLMSFFREAMAVQKGGTQ